MYWQQRFNRKNPDKQIEEEIIEVGKRTIIDLGIHGLHPELVKIVLYLHWHICLQNLAEKSASVIIVLLQQIVLCMVRSVWAMKWPLIITVFWMVDVVASF